MWCFINFVYNSISISSFLFIVHKHIKLLSQHVKTELSHTAIPPYNMCMSASLNMPRGIRYLKKKRPGTETFTEGTLKVVLVMELRWIQFWHHWAWNKSNILLSSAYHHYHTGIITVQDTWLCVTMYLPFMCNVA